MLDWSKIKTSKADMKLCTEIAKRGEHLVTDDFMALVMDIEACHATNPLDLVRFLNADKLNFAHDFCGIFSNLNRKTGKLDNFFVPRFSL